MTEKHQRTPNGQKDPPKTCDYSKTEYLLQEREKIGMSGRVLTRYLLSKEYKWWIFQSFSYKLCVIF